MKKEKVRIKIEDKESKRLKHELYSLGYMGNNKANIIIGDDMYIEIEILKPDKEYIVECENFAILGSTFSCALTDDSPLKIKDIDICDYFIIPNALIKGKPKTKLPVLSVVFYISDRVFLRFEEDYKLKDHSNLSGKVYFMVK